MCGIAGQFMFNGSVDVDVLTRMRDCMQHRGPSDSGVYVNDPVGIAHQRLSIIDPEAGEQPVFNEDDSVAVIFNGEIYNYESLRADLERRGHQFTTETDTETLVHLYEEYGHDLVEELRGMFAFALWDTNAERLVLARDPMGIKPLVVGQTNDTLTFASELLAILNSDMNHGGLDQEGLASYFAFGYIPAPLTAFQNITKLAPGERMVINSDGCQRDTYYQLSANRVDPGIETAASQLRSLVEDSVRARLMSDVPLGAFLSGGIDSSIIAGTMSNLVPEPIQTFTVGFQEDAFDESWAARTVAEYHDTDHYEFTMTADDVRSLIPTVLDRLGEPFADQSLIPSYVVAQETSNEVTVALSGDGADELFAGYDKYRVESLATYYAHLPQSVRNGLIRPLINRFHPTRNSRFGSLAHKAQWFANRDYPEDVSARHFELMRVVDNATASTVFTNQDPIETGRRRLTEQHNALAVDIVDRSDLTRIQAVDTRYSLPNQMLMKADLAGMYNSLEVRVPFLDTSVVEYAFSLPRCYKLTATDRKRVLKRAFDDILPDKILSRGKQGFDMPIGKWFRDELHNDFLELLDTVDTGILENDAVRAVLRDHITGEQNHAKFLWSVYVFKYWARQMQQRGVISADG